MRGGAGAPAQTGSPSCCVIQAVTAVIQAVTAVNVITVTLGNSDNSAMSLRLQQLEVTSQLSRDGHSRNNKPSLSIQDR